MTLAYSYARYSSQGQDASSITRQVEAARAFANASGWTLDEHMTDTATSAYRGTHAKTGMLGKFLRLIEGGKINAGSWLIVEAMDRLSREEATEALSQFLNIIRAGVGIATLTDGKTYTKASVNKNTFDLMYSIMLMSSANEYSSKLAYRVKKSIERDRALNRNGTFKALHGSAPFWLDYNEATKAYSLNTERAATTRRIIGWAMAGVSALSISKRLHAEGIRSARGKEWFNDASIMRMLRTPALMGVCTLLDKTQEPIKGYYPSLLTEREFYALQGSLDTRKRVVRGRHGEHTNIFGQLLADAEGSQFCIHSRKNQQGVNYISLIAIAGMKMQKQQASFPYHSLEQAFLKFVPEITLAEQKPSDDLREVTGHKVAKQARLAEITRLIESGEVGKIAVLAQTAEKLETEIQALTAQEEIIKAQRATPTVNTADVEQLAKELAATDDRGEVRRRLKVAVAQIVRGATLHVYVKGVRRVAIMRVVMADGEARILWVRTGRGEDDVAGCNPVLTFGEGYQVDFDGMGHFLLNAPNAGVPMFNPMAFTKAWPTGKNQVRPAKASKPTKPTRSRRTAAIAV